MDYIILTVEIIVLFWVMAWIYTCGTLKISSILKLEQTKQTKKILKPVPKPQLSESDFVMGGILGGPKCDIPCVI